MKIDVKTSYGRDLKKIKDKAFLQEVKAVVEEVEQTTSLDLISRLEAGEVASAFQSAVIA